MKSLFAVLVLVQFTGVFAQNHPILANHEVASNIQLLELWIQNQMEFRGIPGLVVGVVHDQDLVWAKGFGYADLEKERPMTTSTIFRIASITKVFTGIAIMQLRDQGKLRLDDPVVRHLSWFKYRNRHSSSPPITIWNLLTHTSGLPRESAFPYWTDRKFPTRDQMIEALQQQESIFAPSTRYKYSNLGVGILGEVVAAVSKMSYEEYVRRNILEPLGMTSTTVHLREEDKLRLATGYGRRKKDGTRAFAAPTELNALAPAGNMSSTVEDLAGFAALQFRDGPAKGSQILAGSALREMHRAHWIQPGWKNARGLGFGVSKTDARVLVGHSGWVGGYRSQLTFSPSEKVAVIVMVNADDGIPTFFANRIMNVLAPLIKKATAPTPVIAQVDSSWHMYLGKYANPFGWETEVMIYNNELVLYGYSYPPEEDPSGEPVTLTPEGPHTFRMTGDNGNGELVVFEADSQSKVQRVEVGENYIYPLE